MRIFTNPVDATKEVERDLWEMGIVVHPQTMQDKVVGHLPEYTTKEIRGYAFKLSGWQYNWDDIVEVVKYFMPKEVDNVLAYCQKEIIDRVGHQPLNPGNSYLERPDVWDEFLHHGKFAYTYSERMAIQVHQILNELVERPDTRQGIITMHTNICPTIQGLVINQDREANYVELSADFYNRGGGGRIPCSMYYQVMIREEKIDIIYTMRSCDLLTHFPIDISLALMLQNWFAKQLKIEMGTFTYFVGSLHAYYKDIADRGVF